MYSIGEVYNCSEFFTYWMARISLNDAISCCGGSEDQYLNLLKTKRNLLYIRNQSVPRSKHFPPRL